MSLLKIMPILLATGLALCAQSAEPQNSLTLFDFVQSPDLSGWQSQPWTKDKPNNPRTAFDAERGLHLAFPQENVDDHSYAAPNLYYLWPKPQDWSGYNFLAVDIYNPSNETDRMEIDLLTDNGKARVSHHKIFVPARQQIQLRIPLSAYQNWKAAPANLAKVKRISLIRRAPPRELNFYIRSIKLLKLEAPARQYAFDGLKAWQFGDAAHPVKEGFELVTPDSPLWTSGRGTAVKALPNPSADSLWNSMITGTAPAELSLPVEEDGEYLVFALFQGRRYFRSDTLINVGGGREYRHLIANAFPEYRLFKTTAKDRRINVSLRPKSPGFPWSITALAAMKAEKSAELLEQFIWPAYDDMVVAPWSLRSFLQEKSAPTTAEFTAWDLYNHDFRETATLDGPAFSCLPPASGTFSISCPEGFRVKRAMHYTRSSYDGYIRQPRFFATVTDEISVRQGLREYFLLIPPADAVGRTLRGELRFTGPDDRQTALPFAFDQSRLSADATDMNYFLYYYTLGFTGGAESSRAQVLQERDELAFIRASGFKSLETSMMTSASEKDGKLVFNFSPMINFMKKYAAHGFDTSIPMPLYLYNQIHRINQHIGKANYLYSGEKLEQSIEAVQDFIRQANAALSKEPFCPPPAYYPFDEFGNYAYVSRMHRAIREAGGLTYSTSVGRYGNGFNISAGDGLDIYCFPGLTGADPARLKQDIAGINAKFWRYTIEYSNPLQDRYAWGLASWHMGVTAHGAWHYDGRGFSLSELQNGSYYYAYAAYGNGEVMPSVALLGVADAMRDYAALSILEKSGRAPELLAELRKDAARLGPRPSDGELLQWFNHGGREKLRQLRAAAEP